MRNLVARIKDDLAFSNVNPRVSMASIMLARGEAKRRVMVAWHEDGQYRVYFVDPELEFSQPTAVGEDAVVGVLRSYLDGLGNA